MRDTLATWGARWGLNGCAARGRLLAELRGGGLHVITLTPPTYAPAAPALSPILPQLWRRRLRVLPGAQSTDRLAHLWHLEEGEVTWWLTHLVAAGLMAEENSLYHSRFASTNRDRPPLSALWQARLAAVTWPADEKQATRQWRVGPTAARRYLTHLIRTGTLALEHGQYRLRQPEEAASALIPLTEQVHERHAAWLDSVQWPATATQAAAQWNTPVNNARSRLHTLVQRSRIIPGTGGQFHRLD